MPTQCLEIHVDVYNLFWIVETFQHDIILTSALGFLGRFAAEHNHTPTASRLVCAIYS